MTKQRSSVAAKDKWNVESLYKNPAAWEKEFKAVAEANKNAPFALINKFKGKLKKDAKTLKNALDLILELSRKVHTLYTYAHLRHDEDITDDANKKNYIQITNLLYQMQAETAWFEPEILEIPTKDFKALLKSPELKDYKFYLEKIERVKKHTLSADKEELIALTSKAMATPSKAFSAINDADFHFGTILDSKGKAHELTQSTYSLYLKDQDRDLRKNAFERMLGQYAQYENTMCELISGNVQAHYYNAKVRNYKSCLEASLYPKNIDTEVYHSLISAVNDNIDVLHRYVRLRQKILNIGPLHLYDMYVPITKDLDISLTYEEAENAVIESVAPLGDEYQSILRKGLLKDRWVDRFPNAGKRSGAYSSGCFDSMPYILMNFKGMLRDTFTLAHEAGHSMHSYMSHKHQPYQYSDYPIFLAEVASTFNEDLLMRHLKARAKTNEEKIYLVNQQIEDIRATLFRQTMFAEFELFIHDMAEKNVPITPKLLKDQSSRLNALYFGPAVIDPLIEVEWARIPHFYYNFYVYQYATGISAALALSERVNNGGKKEREDYLSFLKSGSSRYPIETLKKAGVDMRSSAPVEAAINKFKSLVEELDSLVAKTSKKKK